MTVEGAGEFERERSVQGRAWDSVHLGYFSDPEAADVLADAVLRRAEESRPEAVADIGGGTGFILAELARRGLDPGVDLVNLDISPAQLAAGRHRKIRRVRGSVTGFRRTEILEGGGEILFVMRSVLHYLGPEGMPDALRHIRGQMKKGEYFIHQTACFDEGRDAGCLNAIYAGMGSAKRYPATGDLTSQLEAAGFWVVESRPAPPLVLTPGALGKRYGLSRDAMEEIGRGVRETFGIIPGVFEYGRNGFTAYLRYRVFVTRAGQENREQLTRSG